MGGQGLITSGGEGQDGGRYLYMQLIHLSPELGRALCHGDGSRCLINFKGSITSCHRRDVPCSSEQDHTVAQGELCQASQGISSLSLLYLCVLG